MPKNLVILAGGASSRMKKSLGSENLSKEDETKANKRNKALLSFGKNNRPILDFLLLNAKKAGYKNVIIIINEKGEMFKEYYGKKLKNNYFNDLSISYAIQYVPKDRIKPFGTADALFQALAQFPELQKKAFTVCNSDNLYSVEALKALLTCKDANAFINYDRDGLIFPMEKIERFALTIVNKKSNLEAIIEKPSKDKVNNYKDIKGKFRVSMNIFKFTGTEIYSFLKNCPINPIRNEKELPTAIWHMINKTRSYIKAIPFSEHVPDLTSKEDIPIIKSYLEQKYPSYF
jgi:NDP-sugar pyrophosphorylase family protein|tara:strand:- start:1712 stop:2578 length:867 start_codon:yes stop_codon:yes gene_type:complete